MYQLRIELQQNRHQTVSSTHNLLLFPSTFSNLVSSLVVLKSEPNDDRECGGQSNGQESPLIALVKSKINSYPIIALSDLTETLQVCIFTPLTFIY